MTEYILFMISYLQALTSIELVAILIILPMAFTVCHEAGHYYAAYLCGVGSDEFALGRGPTILRIPVSSVGCNFAFRLFPFGGCVTYAEGYWLLSYAKCALLAASGWLADVVLWLMCYSMQVFIDTSEPIYTFIFFVISVRVCTGLLPVTSDGRKTVYYLYLAITRRSDKH